MRRSHFAPLALALSWFAIIATVNAKGPAFLPTGLWVPIVLVLFALIACWAAWRFRAWFQFSAVSRALFLPIFVWAFFQAAGATQDMAYAVFPLFGGGHTIAFVATMMLAASLVKAMLVSLLLVPPLVIVYQRYAPVVAAIICVLPIWIEVRTWPAQAATRPMTQWLMVADSALLFTALIGFAWLVSRKGVLSNLSLTGEVPVAALR